MNHNIMNMYTVFVKAYSKKNYVNSKVQQYLHSEFKKAFIGFYHEKCYNSTSQRILETGKEGSRGFL